MTRLAQVAMPERENRRSPKFYLEAKWSRFLFCSLFCSFSHGFCTFSRAFFPGKCKGFAFPDPQNEKRVERASAHSGPQTPTPKRAPSVASWSQSVSRFQQLQGPVHGLQGPASPGWGLTPQAKNQVLPVIASLSSLVFSLPFACSSQLRSSSLLIHM